jgi:hypothetical protein
MGRWLLPPSRLPRTAAPVLKVVMQLSDWEKRRVSIWEQLREIESELFLLSARSVALSFEYGQRFERLCRERTRLASRLLLNGATPPTVQKQLSVVSAESLTPVQPKAWRLLTLGMDRPPRQCCYDSQLFDWGATHPSTRAGAHYLACRSSISSVSAWLQSASGL